MSTVTYEELAKLINGHNHDDSFTKYVMKMARENNLVIVSAIGDDTIQFDGAFHDEIDLFRGGAVYVTEEGIFTKPKEGRFKIDVFWEDRGLCVWKFLTTIPNTKFNINKSKKKWCEGMVFCLNDLKK
jgi:hypothetical protein